MGFSGGAYIQGRNGGRALKISLVCVHPSLLYIKFNFFVNLFFLASHFLCIFVPASRVFSAAGQRFLFTVCITISFTLLSIHYSNCNGLFSGAF